MRIGKYGRLPAAGFWAAVVIAAGAPGCGYRDSDVAPSLSYRLEWDFSGTGRDAASGGWTVTNNRDYSITVTRGYLVAYSVAFLPCRATAGTAGNPSAAAFDTFRIGPRPAYAGHDGVFVNPVKTPKAIVESLLTASPTDAGSFEPEAVRYCRVHYVLARAQADAIGLPEDVDMIGQTAHVEGSYRRPTDAAEVPFTIRSPSANAVLEDVFFDEAVSDGEEAGFDGRAVRATAIVIRRAAKLFQDIDFENDGKHRIPWQFLKNVADASTVRVEMRPVHGGSGR